MIQIHTCIAHQVPIWVAQQCAESLCWDESESQALFQRIARMELPERERGWMIGYAVIEGRDWYDDEDEVVGWVTVTEWVVGQETRIQVQGYVRRDMRQQGIASALVACLCHDMPKSSLPVAVFSKEFFRIAQRRGWRATQYKSVDDGWIAVATTEGRDCGGGSDTGGVHAAPSEVRDLPLACDEKGAAP